jgi:nucleoside-diphosphate-sugar epimerase
MGRQSGARAVRQGGFVSAPLQRTYAVTGATGFTGGALARRLLDEGYRVRALTRREPPNGHALDGVEWIAGELTDPAALSRLVEGVDGCFHVAAMYRTEGTPEAFNAINAHSTALLIEVAREARVRRIVYCSSIGVHGSVDAASGDEDTPFSPRDPYQHSKVLAENICTSAAEQGGIEMVIVRPCGIYGPGDTRMLKMFSMIQRGAFFFVGSGSAHFHPVYIDDLVEGFVLAMTVPEAAGGTYIIGAGEHLPLRDYVATAAQALGSPAPRRHVSYPLMNLAAGACELLCAPFGIQPPLHRRRLTFFKHHRAFDIGRARRELGYAPRVSLEEGFRRTVAWYRQQGMLR